VPVDFESNALVGAYGGRNVSRAWRAWCVETLVPAGKDVLDIGCGAGIYARGFAALGAHSVVGVDGSESYVREARAAAAGMPDLRFVVGDAGDTGLPDACADLIYHRAVIHHLNEAERAIGAEEMRRVLRPAGRCAVQDRTIDDVEAAGSEFWVRATLMRVFPRLFAVERARRPSASVYCEQLRRAGFEGVAYCRLVETRRVYASFDELEADVLARRGKSILFELSDAELRRYCAALREARPADGPWVEADPWTVWLGAKPP
jgi:ubiquinone/menaquinone biosynthesis C-methylase UbiE